MTQPADSVALPTEEQLSRAAFFLNEMAEELGSEATEADGRNNEALFQRRISEKADCEAVAAALPLIVARCREAETLNRANKGVVDHLIAQHKEDESLRSRLQEAERREDERKAELGRYMMALNGARDEATSAFTAVDEAKKEASFWQQEYGKALAAAESRWSSLIEQVEAKALEAEVNFDTATNASDHDAYNQQHIAYRRVLSLLRAAEGTNG